MELRIDIGYDRKRPLYTDVCLSFVRGDIINVVGDNGSGKSTLYKTLCGSIPPLRGKIPREVADSCMLVSDTIRPPSELLVSDVFDLIGDSASAIRDAYPQISSVLGPLMGRRIGSLSFGQRRILEIASVLSSSKSILILDEALANLDFINRLTCIQIVQRLDDQVVFNTSHDLGDVIELGGRIIFLDRRAHAFVEYEGERTVESLRKFMGSRILTATSDYGNKGISC